MISAHGSDELKVVRLGYAGSKGNASLLDEKILVA